MLYFFTDMAEPINTPTLATKTTPSPVDPSQPTTFEAIDIRYVNQMLHMASDYLSETRQDFAVALGNAQPWIDALAQLLQETTHAMRNLEVTAMTEMTKWKDDEGLSHDVILRSIDPHAFDAAVQLFMQAQEQFDRYFKKHIALMKLQRRGVSTARVAA